MGMISADGTAVKADLSKGYGMGDREKSTVTGCNNRLTGDCPCSIVSTVNMISGRKCDYVACRKLLIHSNKPHVRGVTLRRYGFLMRYC